MKSGELTDTWYYTATAGLQHQGPRTTVERGGGSSPEIERREHAAHTSPALSTLLKGEQGFTKRKVLGKLKAIAK